MSLLLEWGTTVVSALAITAFVLALLIVQKAIRGYRQNDDPAMFLLAAGLFLLVLVPLLVEVTVTLFFDETSTVGIAQDLLQQTARISGLGAILASMYVSRGGQH